MCIYFAVTMSATSKNNVVNRGKNNNNNSIIFMENALKNANKMQPKWLRSQKQVFVYGGNHLCAGRFIAPFFCCSLHTQTHSLCAHESECSVYVYVYIVDFVSVFCLVSFVCLKFWRILSAFEIIAFAVCSYNVHISVAWK